MSKILLGAAGIFAAASLQAAVYLKADAPEGGDGTSWSKAYRTIEEALTNLGDDATIYIAKGYYGFNKVVSNHAFDTLKLYGGYLGKDDGDMTRDTAEYQSILGGPTTAPTGNWTHVVPNEDGFGVTTEASSEKVIVDGKLNLPQTTGDYDTYYFTSAVSYGFRIGQEIVADGLVFFGFNREGSPGGSAIGVNDKAMCATITNCVFAGGDTLQRAMLYIGTTTEECAVADCRFCYNRAAYSSNPNFCGTDKVVVDRCEFVGSLVDSGAPNNGALEKCKSVSNSLFTHTLVAQGNATPVNMPLVQLGTGTMKGCVISNNYLAVRHATNASSGMIFGTAGSSAVSQTLIAGNRLVVDARDGLTYALVSIGNGIASGGPYVMGYEDLVVANNVLEVRRCDLESGSFALGIAGSSTPNRTMTENFSRCTFLDNAFEVTPPSGVSVTCANLLVTRTGGNVTGFVDDCVFSGVHPDGVYDIAQYGTVTAAKENVMFSAFVDTEVDAHPHAVLDLGAVDVSRCAVQKTRDSLTLNGTPLLYRGAATGYEVLHHPPTVTLTFLLGNAALFTANRRPIIQIEASALTPFPALPEYEKTRDCNVLGWTLPETVPEEDSYYHLEYTVDGVTLVRVAPGGTGDGSSWGEACGSLAMAYATAAAAKGPAEVILQEGTHTLAAPITIMPDVTVSGCGEAEIVPSENKVQWAFAHVAGDAPVESCLFKNVTIKGFYCGAINASSGELGNLVVENCHLTGNGTQGNKDTCRTIYLKNGVLEMRETTLADDYFGVYLYCDSLETAAQSLIERCSFVRIRGGQKCSALRVEGFGGVQLSSTIFDGCRNDSPFTAASAALTFSPDAKSVSDSSLDDCTFRNCVSEGTCVGVIHAMARDGHPLRFNRCLFLENDIRSGGTISYRGGTTVMRDCAFVRNALETTQAADCHASAVTVPMAAKVSFVNCTFDGNTCVTANAGATVGTVAQAHHNGYLTFINSVFTGSVFSGEGSTDCADIRSAKEGTYAFTRTALNLINTILWNDSESYRAIYCTDEATETAMSFANCCIKNFDYATYATFMAEPTTGKDVNWGYVSHVITDDPQLLVGVYGTNGVYAVQADPSGSAARQGFPIRLSTAGGHYFMLDGAWRSATDRYAAVNVEELGLSLDSPRLPDAWGQSVPRHRSLLGPVTVPSQGLLVIFK